MRRALMGLTVVAAMAVVGTAPAGAGSTSAADVADAGVIVASDLTADFEASPPSDATDGELVKQAKKIKVCKDYVKIRKAMDKATDDESDDFQSSSEAISNHVYVFDKEGGAEKVLDQAKRKKMADCFTDAFQAILEKQLKGDKNVDKIRVRIENVPNLTDELGEQSVAYSGGLEATYKDGSPPDRFIVSTVLVREGPAVIAYQYQALPNENTDALGNAIDNSLLRTQIALQLGT